MNFRKDFRKKFPHIDEYSWLGRVLLDILLGFIVAGIIILSYQPQENSVGGNYISCLDGCYNMLEVIYGRGNVLEEHYPLFENCSSECFEQHPVTPEDYEEEVNALQKVVERQIGKS